MDDPRDVDCDLIETVFTAFDRTARYAWRWAAIRWRGSPSPSILAHPDREAHHGAGQGEAEAAHSVTVDCLTFFGLVAVTLMLVFYWLEPRNRHYILAFAGACLLASAFPPYLALGPLGGRGDLGGSRGWALG